MSLLGQIKRFFSGLIPAQPAQQVPIGAPADIGAEFREQVVEATRLLNFLLREGPPDHISDPLIKEIENAREFLKDKSSVPSKEARISFLTAYRDLINTPRYSVTYVDIPPTPFWSWDSWWPWLLLLFSIIPSIIWFVILPWSWAGIYLLASVLTIFGVYVFTGVVTDRKLNQIIRYCYVFTGIALLLAIVPFFSADLFSGSLNNAAVGKTAPVAIQLGCGIQKGGFPPGEVACDSDPQKSVYQWVVRIGGAESTATAGATTAQRISGGVVVPLYIIVLSLFGGAVSMTRRVPEYQGRAMDAQDPLTNVQAREYLVFQIMQLVSAPLIAITVYYIVQPKTALTSVIVGFGSGFASEPILLMIRSLVEKLSPSPSTEPGAVSVRVDPPSVTLRPKETKQFNATILGSSNRDLTWLIDPVDASAGTLSQNGFYVAPDTPPTRAVTITARSAADPTKSSSASVTVATATSEQKVISVKVTPKVISLKPKAEQQFQAEVSGSSNTAVKWSRDPEEGSITPDGGLYRAPEAAAKTTVTITAHSVEDPTESDSATVSVEP